MKLLKGQLSLFDFMDDDEPKEDERFPVAEFDKLFRVGSRFLNGSNVVEITDMRKGELSAQIRNITLEKNGKYVGARYYINKESYGTWYLGIAENGNVMPCPYRQKCRTYQIGCFGISHWCGKEGFR
jgi:hypothetical protein